MHPYDLTQWPEDVLKQLLKACEKERRELCSKMAKVDACETTVSMVTTTEWWNNLDSLTEASLSLEMALRLKHQTV